uniref:Uncharacterized protein n=1 Tax=Setaria italica TaxID=4555 RepID=K3Z214_SETIT
MHGSKGVPIIKDSKLRRGGSKFYYSRANSM